MTTRGGSLGTATLRLRSDGKQFNRGLESAESKAKKTFALIGKHSRAAGLGLVAAGAVLTAGVAKSLGVFGQFEQAMANVQAVSGATVSEFEQLNEIAKEMGETTVFTATQSAQALSFMAMAGLNAQQSLAALPELLNIAAAGNLELAQAADIVTNIMSGYGIAAEDVGQATDVLVTGFTSANTNLLQLGEAFKLGGPVAKAAGLSFEETAAALSLMGNAGFQSTLAGTALRGAITRLLNPTGSAQKIMAELGITATDTSGELLPLRDIISQFETVGLSAGDAMAIFGQRAGPGMLALIQQGTGALVDLTTEMQTSGGTAERIAKAQLDTFQGQITLMKSAVEGLALSLGEQLAPAVRDIVVWFTKVVQSVIGWTKDHPELTKILVLSTAAVGAMALALGGLLIATSLMLPALQLLTARLVSVRLAMLATLGPVGLVITGVTALVWILGRTQKSVDPAVAKLGAFERKLYELRKEVGYTSEAIEDRLNAALRQFIKVVEDATPVAQAYADVLADMVPEDLVDRVLAGANAVARTTDEMERLESLRLRFRDLGIEDELDERLAVLDIQMDILEAQDKQHKLQLETITHQVNYREGLKEVRRLNRDILAITEDHAGLATELPELERERASAIAGVRRAWEATSDEVFDLEKILGETTDEAEHLAEAAKRVGANFAGANQNLTDSISDGINALFNHQQALQRERSEFEKVTEAIRDNIRARQDVAAGRGQRIAAQGIIDAMSGADRRALEEEAMGQDLVEYLLQSNKAAVDSMAAERAAAVAEERERIIEAISAAEQDYRDYLVDLQESYNDDISRLNDDQRADEMAATSRYNAAVVSARERLNVKLAGLNNEQLEAEQASRKRHRKEILDVDIAKSFEDQREAETEAQRRYEKDNQEILEDHLRDLDDLREDHARDQQRSLEDHHKGLGELGAKHFKDLAELEDDHLKDQADVRGDYQQDLADLEEDHLKNQADLREDYERDQQRSLEDHLGRLADIRKSAAQAEIDAALDRDRKVEDIDRGFERDLEELYRDISERFFDTPNFDIESYVSQVGARTDILEAFMEGREEIVRRRDQSLQDSEIDHARDLEDIARDKAEDEAREKERHLENLNSLQVRHDDRMAAATVKYNEAQAQRLAVHRLTLDNLEEQYQEQRRSRQSQYDEQVLALQARYEQQRSDRQVRHDEQVLDRQAKHDERMRSRQVQYDEQVLALRARYEQQRTDRQARYDEQETGMAARHREELQTIRATYDQQRLTLQNQADAGETARAILHEAELERIGTEYDGLRARRETQYQDEQVLAWDQYWRNLRSISDAKTPELESAFSRALDGLSGVIDGWASGARARLSRLLAAGASKVAALEGLRRRAALPPPVAVNPDDRRYANDVDAAVFKSFGDGGIVKRPMFGVVGDKEEAIIPLDQLDMLRPNVQILVSGDLRKLGNFIRAEVLEGDLRGRQEQVRVRPSGGRR